jgi:hypothetical protein
MNLFAFFLDSRGSPLGLMESMLYFTPSFNFLAGPRTVLLHVEDLLDPEG